MSVRPSNRFSTKETQIHIDTNKNGIISFINTRTLSLFKYEVHKTIHT